MNAKLSFAALITVFLLLNANVASARKKEAAGGTTYRGCLQHEMAAAPQGDPGATRAKVLGDCLLYRQSTLTVTEALLVLDGETKEAASADAQESVTDDDRKGLGISRQDDAALFAVYGALETKFATARADYRIHPDGRVECVLTQSSDDPEIDAIECNSLQGCPALNSTAGADNTAAMNCLSTEQSKELLLLAIRRSGLAFFSPDGERAAPVH